MNKKEKFMIKKFLIRMVRAQERRQLKSCLLSLERELRSKRELYSVGYRVSVARRLHSFRESLSVLSLESCRLKAISDHIASTTERSIRKGEADNGIVNRIINPYGRVSRSTFFGYINERIRKEA